MGQNMEAVSQAVNGTTIKDPAETLFSYLDKGIDDMESGREHTADEAFQIIQERIKNELCSTGNK